MTLGELIEVLRTKDSTLEVLTRQDFGHNDYGYGPPCASDFKGNVINIMLYRADNVQRSDTR